MSVAGRPPPWCAKAAVLLLLVAAALPCLVALVGALQGDAPPSGPSLQALSSALEKAHRCLQGDDRAGLGALSPLAAAAATTASVAPRSPAPAAPCPPAPAPDAARAAASSLRL